MAHGGWRKQPCCGSASGGVQSRQAAFWLVVPQSALLSMCYEVPHGHMLVVVGLVGADICCVGCMPGARQSRWAASSMPGRQ